VGGSPATGMCSSGHATDTDTVHGSNLSKARGKQPFCAHRNGMHQGDHQVDRENMEVRDRFLCHDDRVDRRTQQHRCSR